MFKTQHYYCLCPSTVSMIVFTVYYRAGPWEDFGLGSCNHSFLAAGQFWKVKSLAMKEKMNPRSTVNMGHSQASFDSGVIDSKRHVVTCCSKYN